MINDMVKQAFIDNAPSDVRDVTATWFDIRDETLNRCYSIDGYEEMDVAEQRVVYDSFRSQVIEENATSHTYEVEIYGQDYDFENNEWVEGSHECVSQNCYDNYEAAVAAVKSITPLSATKMEQQSGCNGLDVVIYERSFIGDNEMDWHEVGYAEWIGACCNGITV